MNDDRPTRKQRHRKKVEEGGQFMTCAVIIVIVLAVLFGVLELLGVDTSVFREVH